MLNTNQLIGFGAGGISPRSTDWKLTFPSTPTYTFASEVEMRATAGGADQCNGGTATGGPVFYGEPARAFDNNVSNSFGMFSTGRYVAYAFSSPVEVNEIAYTNMSPSDSPGEITLSYYDGAAWVAVKTWAGLTWATSYETKLLAV